jgi:hypothetical protein
VRLGHDVGHFGHEMHAAEDDVLGVGLRGEARELQRVAGEVGVLVDVGALVVVAEDDGALAERARAARMRSWQASSCNWLNGRKLMVAVALVLILMRFPDESGKANGRLRLAELFSLPGQAGMAPAAQFAALAVGVLVALEAFEHVVAFGVAGLAGQARHGASGAAAADEHHQRFGIDLLLQLGQEIGLGLLSG